MVIQSDGEPSIVALKTAAADAAGVECVPRESPVGEHQANGLVENACREIKRQVRVARSALEEKVGRPLSDSDRSCVGMDAKARWGSDEPVQERYRW